jgi:predicted RNA-binding protein with RPS1 domain
MNFWLVVEFYPNKDGMIHISKIISRWVNDIQEKQEVKMKVIEIDQISKLY